MFTSSSADLFDWSHQISFKCSSPKKKFAIHYLEVELSGGLFELGKISSQFGQRNVDGSADGGAQVGWAEGQETVFIVVREGNPLLDFVDGVNETGIDGLQVTTFLHGDDAQVIFLVAPNQEGLGVVVVDATSGGPVAAGVGSLKFKIKFNLPNLIDLIETQNVIPEGSDLPP